MIINNLLGLNFNTESDVAQFRINIKKFLKKRSIYFDKGESTDLLLGKAIINGYVHK